MSAPGRVHRRKPPLSTKRINDHACYLCGLGKLLWPDFLQRFYSWLETWGAVEVADLRHHSKCLEMTGQAL